jgi:hypothetical protein
MQTKTVAVTFIVDVTLDETKFTPEFMEKFRGSFYDFYTLDDHTKHLAKLVAEGIVCENYRFAEAGIEDDTFVEGYGLLSDMDIALHIKDVDAEVD